MTQSQGQTLNCNTTNKKTIYEYNSKSLTDYWILMIHIMMDINEHQDQRYTLGDNNGRDLYLLGVNVLVLILLLIGLKLKTTTKKLVIFV